MKGFNSILPAAMAVGAGLLQKASASLPTVSTNGNAFFAGGQRFYIRGVDYQPGGSSDLADPLADKNTCTRDIKYFQQLGINAIRVYSVDNSQSHDDCMSALDAAGIYLILDVNSPLYSLNRVDPGPSYNPTYLQSIFATMEMFSKYDNTLAFFSGNEVINQTTQSTEAGPYIKAVTRDMKQFQGDRQLRKIPIGYSAGDFTTNRYETAEYMNCGTDDERSDFFAFNDYSWCDPSSFTTSGWDQKVALFKNYSLPIFLSEYGCNTNTRKFEEVKSLYSTDMTGTYSGGLVYEYSQEDSNYGLVNVNSDGSISTRPDFDALQSAFKGTSNPSGDGGFTTNNKPSQCPPASSTWMPKDDSLPAMPDGAKQYLQKGAGTGPGLKGNNGAGSQNAGGASTATATPGSGAPSTTPTMGSSSGSSGGSPGSSSSSAAAGIVIPDFSYAPLACTMIVVFWSAVGAALL